MKLSQQTTLEKAGPARSALVKKLVFSAMFLALCMVLPYLTGQIPQIGAALSPMHIPVFLCGFVCGWPWALAVGAIAPLLRHFAFGGMPPLLKAIPMTFELATYGAVSGLLYKLLPRRKWAIYVSLIAAMVAGRLVWGCGRFVMAGLQHTDFPLSAFWAGAVTEAVPGIILHIVLIPLLVMAMERAHLTFKE